MNIISTCDEFADAVLACAEIPLLHCIKDSDSKVEYNWDILQLNKEVIMKIEELLKKGQTSLNTGNPKEALGFYDKVLEINPLEIEALLKKGHILGKLARYQQAITFYDKVLQQEENLLALLNKGLAHHYISEYDVAIDCFDKVLVEKPQNTTALYNKASSLIKSDNLEKGFEVLEQVVKLDFSYKVKAQCDLDFQDIKKLNEFKRIVL